MHPEDPDESLFQESEEAFKEPSSSPSSAEITISKEEYETLVRNSEEYKSKYLRALADMENARKRLMKERDDNAQQAVIEVICDFLAPLDHMEHALEFAEQMSPEVKTWATGFQMILMQFKEVLEANGVTPIVALGHKFDPHRHEAIASVETKDAAPDTIIKDCRRGYCKGKRTIRPSRVEVAKAPSQENLSPAEQREDLP